MRFNDVYCVVGGVSAFILLSVIGMVKVNSEVKDPYMDEIFHVPQAQRFCDGQYFEVKRCVHSFGSSRV
jgi:alpha-1,2-glucosyltransferase